MRKAKSRLVLAALLTMCAAPLTALAHECPPGFPDEPAISKHMEQLDIASGALSFDAIGDHGKALFVARFNVCDGQGRPATTSGGDKRAVDEPAKLRTSAPDSDACAGCHAQPRAGGAGDFVANVFVLAQTLDPTTFSVAPELSDERNTLGMNGSGPIEMLAREMTVDLQSQVAGLPDGNHTLTTKGVAFDVMISDGQVVASRGVNTDLIIRPFHQAGVVISLREFTDNAFNHHHGIQAEERFDLNPAKGFDADYDEDGVHRELTVGDVTAVTVWQAPLGVPRRVISKDNDERQMARRGERVFDDVGCTSCHKPELLLESRLLVEPNPFNPPPRVATRTSVRNTPTI